MIEQCIWKHLFDDESRDIVNEGFVFTGCISVFLGLWLNVILFSTNLKEDLSYRNLSYFTFIALVRRALPLLLYVPFMRYIVDRDGFQSCELFASFETFLAVFEIETLTHVCIERYVVAKYITNGWQIQKNHYSLFLFLCLFFSCLYSFPPLFGLGRFGYDFSCTTCTFDMLLPDSWQKYFVTVIFMLRSVKPLIFMVIMLIMAQVLEKKYNVSSATCQKEINFSRSVISLTAVSVACWAPIACIRGWVVLTQLLHGAVMVPAAGFVRWALWLHWVSPAVAVVTLFLVDGRLRHKMLNVCDRADCVDGEGKKTE